MNRVFSGGRRPRYRPPSARCCTCTPYDVRSSPDSVTSTQLSLVRNSIGSAHPTFSGAIVPIGMPLRYSLSYAGAHVATPW